VKNKSEAEAYINKNPEWDIYLKYFFTFCKKYKINYASATDKEKAFIAEVTRVTYEKDKAKRDGRDISDVRPAFSD